MTFWKDFGNVLKYNAYMHVVPWDDLDQMHLRVQSVHDRLNLGLVVSQRNAGEPQNSASDSKYCSTVFCHPFLSAYDPWQAQHNLGSVICRAIKGSASRTERDMHARAAFGNTADQGNIVESRVDII